MITNVKLINFKSFGEIEFDLRKSKKKIKSFAAVYGENGSGKTNFIESIQLLVISLISYRQFCKMPDLREQIVKAAEDEKISEKLIIELVKKLNMDDFSEAMESGRMKECDEPTEIEYGIRYADTDGTEHDAVYKLAFTDRIIREELRCWTGKQTGVMFSVSSDEDGNIKHKFNSNMITNKSVADEINETIQKFWGRFSLFSMIFHNINDQNDKYSEDSYSKDLRNVLAEIRKINVVTRKGSSVRAYYTGTKGILAPLTKGRINDDELEVLIRSEKIVNELLTQGYADIKRIEYEIERIGENSIEYTLMFEKMIAGKIRRISIDEESCGTYNLLTVLTPLINSLNGMIVFIDEVDTGIHDILCRNIIGAIRENVNGQLVITTHNTVLLKHIDPSEAYIIDVDSEGNKEMICLDEFGIQPTNNTSNLYMKGQFGGVPVMEPVDCDVVIEALNKTDEELRDERNSALDMIGNTSDIDEEEHHEE